MNNKKKTQETPTFTPPENGFPYSLHKSRRKVTLLDATIIMMRWLLEDV